MSTHRFIIPTTLDTTTKFTWDKAEEYCTKQFNSNLASIHSNLEYETVLQLTSELNLPFDFWIGLTINTSSDLTFTDHTTLTWIDDTKVTWTDESFSEYYLNSNKSEIDMPHKQCVTVSWDIVNCNNKYWPICGSNGDNIIETTYFNQFARTDSLTNTKTSTNRRKEGLVQIVLNDEWLLLGVCLFAGFLGIGIMYCFIIFFCVCYLNLKLKLNKNTKIRKKNKNNMDFGINIAKHFTETKNPIYKNVIMDENGEILTGVKHKHKYKQRTLTVPKPKSKSKTRSAYSTSMHTSVNVRPPNSDRSHLTVTDAASEDVSLMTGLSINGIMKDIIPAVDIETSTEYLYQINNGRMTIGTVQKEESECVSIGTEEQKIIDVIDADLNADEIAIKENIFSIERNLHLLQDIDREEVSEPCVTNESDTEYFDNNLFI